MMGKAARRVSRCSSGCSVSPSSASSPSSRWLCPAPPVNTRPAVPVALLAPDVVAAATEEEEEEEDNDEDEDEDAKDKEETE
jgi:hypothetical protein